jgi:seryl-tRNA synthetase
MLDRRFVIENADLVRRNCAERGSHADVDRFVALEANRKAKQAELETLNRQSNEVSKSIGKAKDAVEREQCKEIGRNLRENIALVVAEITLLEVQAGLILKTIPNLSHPAAPRGADDQANLEIRRGEHAPPKFDFQPLDHVVLGERLDLIDFEGGAKVAGAGFYFLKNDAVLLAMALERYAVDLLIGEGFTPTITPDLARNEVLHGTGYIPRGPETQIYSIADSDLSLVATAEIPLGGLMSDEIVDAEQLPIKICGISHCFRTEAGAGGRASRGLYRVHQFSKVEMFAFTLPDQSDAMLEYFRDLECRIFDGLGLAYRVVDTATGDLGGPAYRKYDLEAWMPGRGTASQETPGEYGEVTSTSNCTDYQARRLGIRYRRKGEKGTSFVHTLNGTAIAVSRALIAVLENYQQADGSIVIPQALRAWMGKERITARK